MADIDPTARTMLALAAITYRGFALESANKQPRRFEVMSTSIARCSATDRWKIVWGPCSDPPNRVGLDQNLMYVAQCGDDPLKIAVAIRGTNPISLKDWIVGDFEVRQLNPWKYGSSPVDASISGSTTFGLDTLRQMSDPENGEQTLKEFLSNFLREKPKAQIFVTGHSKGGALSSTLALWLADTQGAQVQDPGEKWDTDSRATVFAYSFAGPTAGNAAFAEHSDRVLGERCHRIWNARDLVPRAFVPEEMAQIPKLYRLNALESEVIATFVESVTAKVDGLGYKQVCGDGTMFDRGEEPLAKIADEHLDRYLEEYALINEMSRTTLFEILV